MIRDDWLLRQIAALVEGLAGVRRQIDEEIALDGAAAELDALTRKLCGLGLPAIDRLPAFAVAGLLDRAEPARRLALADVLLVAAELADRRGDDGLAGARRDLAEALAAVDGDPGA